MNYILDIYSIASLIIYLFFVYKLRDKNCECSNDWQRKFILIMTYIFLVFNVLFGLIFIFLSNVKRTLIVYYFFIILNIVYTIIIINYTYKLKKNKCECSHIWEREYVYITSLISAILFCICIIIIFILRIVNKNINIRDIPYNVKKIKNNKKK